MPREQQRTRTASNAGFADSGSVVGGRIGGYFPCNSLEFEGSLQIDHPKRHRSEQGTSRIMNVK